MGNFFRGGTTISRVMRAVPRVGQLDESHGVFRDRSMFEFPDGTKSAVFGMGCFWGVERLFWNQNPAVYSTQVGYAGGTKPNPTYEESCQKNVKGQQYRSAIYCIDEADLTLAKASKAAFQDAMKEKGWNKAISTEIKLDSTFYYAEDYHQQYLWKNPGGYCGLKGNGVACPMPPKK